jgi:hypothetical protein
MGAIMGDCQGCCGGGMNCIFHPSGINGIEGSLPLVPMIKGCCGAAGVDPPAPAVVPVVQTIPEYLSGPALMLVSLLLTPLERKKKQEKQKSFVTFTLT